MDFAKYLRKSDVSENSKVYYGQFLRTELDELRNYVTVFCKYDARASW